MAYPTTTRQNIRRRLCQAERMRYYLSYGQNALALNGSQTTTTIQCTSLTQPDFDFWVGSYVFFVSASNQNLVGVERRVTRFDSTNGILTLEYALPVQPSNGDTIELLDIWPPSQIHEAINHAIDTGSKQYVEEITEDSSLCQEEFRLTYPIAPPVLLKQPWHVLQLWQERAVRNLLGLATAGGATTLTDSTQAWTVNQYATYLVSIYAGTGRGQVRTIQSNTATQLTISVAWTTNPDTTSKYCVWNPDPEYRDWYPITKARFDHLEYPAILYLDKYLPTRYGNRIRVIYEVDPGHLTAETDTTVIPDEFIITYARAELHRWLMSDNTLDLPRQKALADWYAQEAEQYVKDNPRRRTNPTMWVESSYGASYNELDPLGWNDGRYR